MNAYPHLRRVGLCLNDLASNYRLCRRWSRLENLDRLLRIGTWALDHDVRLTLNVLKESIEYGGSIYRVGLYRIGL